MRGGAHGGRSHTGGDRRLVAVKSAGSGAASRRGIAWATPLMRGRAEKHVARADMDEREAIRQM